MGVIFRKAKFAVTTGQVSNTIYYLGPPRCTPLDLQTQLLIKPAQGRSNGEIAAQKRGSLKPVKLCTGYVLCVCVRDL